MRIVGTNSVTKLQSNHFVYCISSRSEMISYFSLVYYSTCKELDSSAVTEKILDKSASDLFCTFEPVSKDETRENVSVLTRPASSERISSKCYFSKI